MNHFGIRAREPQPMVEPPFYAIENTQNIGYNKTVKINDMFPDWLTVWEQSYKMDLWDYREKEKGENGI